MKVAVTAVLADDAWVEQIPMTSEKHGLLSYANTVEELRM
jgi:hypothetical protein